MSKNAIASKKLFFFDLDGTLTKSKVPIDKEMASLICELLLHAKVGITSGAQFSRFREQLLSYLHCTQNQYKNLFILPTSGAALYQRQGRRWKNIYEMKLPLSDRKRIVIAFAKAFLKASYNVPKKFYGKIIEDRGSQITFSAIGQRAPLHEKERWNRYNDVRQKIYKYLKPLLRGFVITIAGLTSIDVTKKGIDKTYGITKVMKKCHLTHRDVVYIGDALYKHGNDAVVKRLKIATVQIQDPKQTKQLIRKILKTI